MDQKFYPLSLSALEPGQEAPFAIYLRAGQSNYYLYLPAGSRLNHECYHHLCQSRITTVYVPGRDRDAQIEYLLKLVEQVVQNRELTLQTKVAVVYDTAQQLVQEALLRPIPETIRNCETAARAQVELILSEPQSLFQFLRISKFDYHTSTHSVNVCFMLVAFLHHLDKELDKPALNQFSLGALLHDIGKIQIKKRILDKPGKLTPAEFAEIKKHPVLGLEIVRASYPVPRRAETIILQHHEDLDGGGYPFGLRAEALPMCSRLARIIDIYDALTSYRPYRKPMAPFNALSLMWHEFKGKLDRELLREFIQILGPRAFSIPSG